MKFDLHCHSNASDGKLSPQEVIALVERTDVQLFALTDHDTVAGFKAVKQMPTNFTLVSGIEISSVWSGVGVHIIGLDFDIEHSSVQEAVGFLRNARTERAHIIDERLAKKGMPNTLQGALSFCPDIGQVGRPHFAEYMLQQGYVKSMSDAFDRWLGNGKIGDVKTGWPSLEQSIQWIKDAGGVAVLAHPLRYGMTFSKMRRLISTFKQYGGEAVEILGQQASPDKKHELIKCIKQEGLAGSGGSDFHTPDWAWAQIGKIELLPQDITPVWSLFKHTKIQIQ
jgi:hypothetical protein